MRISPRGYNDPIIPTPNLTSEARDLLAHPAARFQLVDNATGERRDLPSEVYEAVQQVLTALATNQAVSIVPTNMELTTNQAADILNVSRSFIIHLIDKKELPCRLVGTHRRIPLDALLEKRRQMAARATRGLDALAELDQELRLDD
jgi:excisionase family DNA binding protein